MELETWMWVAFGGFVLLMLTVDAVLFGRRGQEISFKRAVGWSIGWTVLGIGFAGFLWIWQGRKPAEEFFAGFLIEKSLSVDNLFVFAMIFSAFAVPLAYQRRALFWGIAGAVVLRGIFILVGAALLDTFHFMIYIFGAFLVITGLKMLKGSEKEIHPEDNVVLKVLGKFMPLTHSFDGDNLVTRIDGKRMATPMLGALVLIAAMDVVFAVDSIPAIFAITRDTFIVFAANAFSLAGLGALYFVLAGMIVKFRYLNVGLAVILVFVGVKMSIADVYKIPVFISLGVILLVLAAAIGYSVHKAPKDDDDSAGGPPLLAPATEESKA
jgi:tellurite resistance protein TerC